MARVLTTVMILWATSQVPASDALGSSTTPDAAPKSGPPSAAVIKLVALEGVKESSADLLTGALVANLRATNHFSRVVTSSEIQTLLGLEQQKQLLNCDTSSCMAELAGALGVDYVVRGELGRLGSSWLVNVTLLNTKTGNSERTVNQQVTGTDEADLLPVMKTVAEQLVGSQAVTVAVAPAGVKKKSGALGNVLKGVGGIGLAAGGVALVLALLGGVTAGGIWGLLAMKPDVTRKLGAGLPLTLGYGAGLAALGVGLVLTLVGVSSGTALLVAGVVLF